MRNYIYTKKENKNELIKKMSYQDCFDYADKIIKVYEVLHSRKEFDFLKINSNTNEMEYTSNYDLVYGEEDSTNNSYNLGSPFIEIFSGVRYFPDEELQHIYITNYIDEPIDFSDIVLNNSEEELFQYSTIYNENEIKHLIIFSALKKNQCREFFMDLNYLELLYDIFFNSYNEPVLIRNEFYEYLP